LRKKKYRSCVISTEAFYPALALWASVLSGEIPVTLHLQQLEVIRSSDKIAGVISPGAYDR
jgi:hypothetical protein